MMWRGVDQVRVGNGVERGRSSKGRGMGFGFGLIKNVRIFFFALHL